MLRSRTNTQNIRTSFVHLMAKRAASDHVSPAPKRIKTSPASPEVKFKRTNSEWKVGAHVSAAGGVDNAITNAASIGYVSSPSKPSINETRANAFALFVKSQRKWTSPALTEATITSFKSKMKEYGYDPRHVLPHGSYLINLGNPDAEKRKKSYDCFLDDLKRCEALGLELYNFHPGSTVGEATTDESIALIAQGINDAHAATEKVVVVIENMAGAGNIIGGDFAHLSQIIQLVKDKTRVGICLDTCHMFAAGYDLRTKKGWDEIVTDLDQQVGLSFLRGMHLNDSKTELNSKRDRHENIGLGHIGLSGFHHILNDTRFQNIPLILETPSGDEKRPGEFHFTTTISSFLRSLLRPMGSISEPISGKTKPGGYDFYREVLGSPKYIVAPMVDQSELAFRRLCRRYGGQLIYTPMISAKQYADPVKNVTYRAKSFDTLTGEEGDPVTDRPLIVQFCANDPEALLTSALAVQEHCDAVDINLGCPQDIAKRGHYGAFLQDEWDLIFQLINTLHKNLDVPVTAKFRVFPSIEKTVEYAKMLERAGAQILTCHGRIREQRGQNSGLASFEHIRAVKQNVSVPVFANGNVLFQEDIETCLRETGCDGVMSAEGVLYNPALFAGLDPASPLSTTDSEAALLRLHPPVISLALEYLEIVKSLKTVTSASAIKGHLFKILRPALPKHPDLRERLGKARIEGVKTMVKAKVKGDKEAGGEAGEPYWKTGLEDYFSIVEELGERMRIDEDRERGGAKTNLELVRPQEGTGLKLLPWWLAQPYWRPLPAVTESLQDQADGKRKKKRPHVGPETTAEAPEEKRMKLLETRVPLEVQ
ncbi:tRNA-dihydrouridine synthase 1 [Mycena indigotica]|uniref:Apurinic-apyrimidinic endonuclease 1 n=1 Tax=Mycena indigotica TaxID=2126181 RepID=A0A8H6S1D3_9AGAR|nr:tRNA-dihydrouridine synthase 1 [Mycena indigotica]KAF7291124.1 tRNA-dihydrouridine synthase 1 [Mycena indigotica]